MQLFRSKQVCVGKTKSASLPNRRFLYFFLIALAFAHLFAIEYTQNINAFIANINTPQHTSINTHPHLHMYVTCAGKQATRKIQGLRNGRVPDFEGAAGKTESQIQNQNIPKNDTSSSINITCAFNHPQESRAQKKQKMRMGSRAVCRCPAHPLSLPVYSSTECCTETLGGTCLVGVS